MMVLVLCTAFLCLSDRLMLLLYTVTLSLCLLLKLNDDDDDDDGHVTCDVQRLEMFLLTCFTVIRCALSTELA